MREALSGGGMSVTEAAGADQPIGRLPTATTGFVGRALRGPVNRAMRVRSFAEYQQMFGGLWQPSMLVVCRRAVSSTTAAAKPSSCASSTAARRRPSRCPAARNRLHARGAQPGFARGAARIDRLRQHRQQRRRPLQPGAAACAHARFGAHRGPGNLPPSFDRTGHDAFRRACTAGIDARARARRRPVRAARSYLPRRCPPPDRLRGFESRRRRRRAADRLRPDRLAGPRHRTCSRCATSRTCISSAFRRPRATATSGRACCSSQRSSVASDARCSSSIRRQRGKPATKHCEGCAGSRSESDHALMCFPRIQAFDRLRGRLETFANSGGGRRHVRPHGLAPLTVGCRPRRAVLLRPGARPVRLLTDAEGSAARRPGHQPAAVRASDHAGARAAEDTRAWLGSRARQRAADGAAPSAAHHQQHRTGHALGAVRRT